MSDVRFGGDGGVLENLSSLVGPLNAETRDELFEAFTGMLQRPLRDPYLRLAEFARVIAGADRAWYRTVDKGNGFTFSAMVAPSDASRPDTTLIPFGRNLGTEAIRQGRPQFTEDLLDDDRIQHTEEQKDRIRRIGTRAVAVIPVITNSVPHGILCVGFRNPVPLTDELVQVCEKLADVATKTVQAEEDWHNTEKMIDELRRSVDEVSRRQNAFAQVFTLERQLVDRAASGHDVDKLVSLLAAEMGSPAVLSDRFGAVIANAGCSAAEARIIADDLRARKHVRVTIGGELVGHLIVGGSRLDETDRARLAAFASAVAVALARRKAIATTKIGLSQNIVDAVIDGLLPETLTSDAHLLGLDLARPSRIVVVAAAREESFSTTTGRTEIEAAIGEVGAAHQVRLCAAWRAAHLIVMIPSAGPEKSKDRHLIHQLLRALSATRAVGRDAALRAGIGGVSTGVQQFPRSYREALTALEANRAEVAEIVFFDDLGVQWLIGQLPTEARRAFHERILGELHKYDAAHGGQLIASLRAFLDARCDAVAAAHTLNVHPNTMRYRLQRVREITGLDMAQADVRLSVELALRAMP